jgi:hypothetical protein
MNEVDQEKQMAVEEGRAVEVQEVEMRSCSRQG